MIPGGSAARDLAWLTARPIAHRGLHEAACGIIENMPAAFAAAIAGNYGIETDLQISADGEAMVHHDDALGRLAAGEGALRDLTAACLKQVAFKATGEHMMTLGELCDLVAGRATLMLELKSRFDGDLRIAARAAAVLAPYGGPVGVGSFDPALICELRRIAPHLARGIIAERHYDHPEWRSLGPTRRLELAFLMHGWAEPPRFPRLPGQRSHGGCAAHGTAYVRSAASDLDGAQRRGSRHRRPLRRPDHLRGISPLTMSRKPAACPEISDLRVRVLPAISEIAAADWDRCAGGADAAGGPNPFTRHAFLAALEVSKSATARTGWQPQHLVAESAGGAVIGVAPCYLKSHSRGEYVFDAGWADAYERAGGSYYPKLQVSVPFTPATGRRLLVAPGPHARIAETTLAQGLVELCKLREASSVHVTFMTQAEWDVARQARLPAAQ